MDRSELDTDTLAEAHKDEIEENRYTKYKKVNVNMESNNSTSIADITSPAEKKVSSMILMQRLIA